MTATDSAPSLARGRLLIVLATVMWSLNGFFIPMLTGENTLGLNLHVPKVHGLHIAFYRAFFAGVVLLPTLRRSDISIPRTMVVTALCFAAMHVMFVLSMAEGGVASAMFLQYTAPTWM